jgi:hypothetical protein
MAVAIRQAFARSARRVRLRFDGSLGSGAFSTAFFSIAIVDGLATTVAPVEAFVVAGRPDELELAVSTDITIGARYLLTVAAGIPDGVGDPGPACSAEFTLGVPATAPSEEVGEQRLRDAIFQCDLGHDGQDFVEGPDGDLEYVSGVENGRISVRRRAAANGLRWDSSFGPGLREFVDAPVFSLPAMRGRLSENLRRDDRVARVDVGLDAATLDDGTVTIPIEVEFVGGQRSAVEVTSA